MYTTFSKKDNNALLEPMFFGNGVNVARYDQQKYEIFEKLTEKQLSFFWRPEEIDISTDRSDFNSMNEAEQHIFISNLKYQTLLDSIQGRGPNMAFLPIVSIPELETWIETWSFSETIHARSYTHIMRNVFVKPEEILDEIVTNEHIIKRAEDISRYYDDHIRNVSTYQLGRGEPVIIDGKEVLVTLRDVKRSLYLVMQCVNALEAIRFYVSFACSFAFAERELMEGNSKIIKLIARDEALHLTGTQFIINLMKSGADDPEMKEIAEELEEQSRQIFLDTAKQEKEWAEYLFKDGSMIGLNKEILWQYIDYITDRRMRAIDMEPEVKVKNNPLPWIDSYLSSDNVQVAPQEVEISSYLVGQIDSNVGSDDLADFDL